MQGECGVKGGVANVYVCVCILYELCGCVSLLCLHRYVFVQVGQPSAVNIQRTDQYSRLNHPPHTYGCDDDDDDDDDGFAIRVSRFALLLLIARLGEEQANLHHIHRAHCI